MRISNLLEFAIALTRDREIIILMAEEFWKRASSTVEPERFVNGEVALQPPRFSSDRQRILMCTD